MTLLLVYAYIKLKKKKKEKDGKGFSSKCTKENRKMKKKSEEAINLKEYCANANIVLSIF